MVNPRKKKFGKLAADSSAPQAPAPSSVARQSPGFGVPSTSTGQTSSFSEQSTSFGQLSSDFGKISFGGGDKAEEEQQLVKFAPKTGPGRFGVPVALKANFFKINITRSPNYYHYNIEIIKDDGKKKENKKDATPRSKKTPKHLNNLVFTELFKTGNKFQIRNVPAFDGEKNFYSLERLNGLTNGMWSGIIKIKDLDKEESFRVNITTPEISHDQTLTSLLNNKNLSITPIELQALDIIMRNGPRLNRVQCGFNFFLKHDDRRHDNHCFNIGKDVMKYGKFGNYQCARIVEDGIYYNVDRAIQIFTYGGRLSDAIDAITRGQGLKTDRDIRLVEEQIKGLKFRALHLNYKRTFIINGLSSKTCKQQTFSYTDQNGKKETCSVYDYYNKNYSNFTSRYRLNPNQLLVQVGSRNNAKYYPIECCELEHDEVYRRKLKPIDQGMVTRISSQQLPSERFSGIEDHVRTIENDSTINGFNYLRNFGIQIETTAAKVQGRIMPAPKVEYANKKMVNTDGKGSWDIKGSKFFKGSIIGSDWCVINIGKLYERPNKSTIYRQKVDKLIQCLVNESRNVGINLSQPRQDVWMYDFDYKCKNSLENSLFKRLKDIKLVFILIPSRDEIYHEIKTVSEIYLRDSQIVTQCLNQEKKYWQDDRLWSQLITNLFLKINPKTGGTNNSIMREDKPPILKSKLMIIGLDVTHPSPTDGFSRSVAAVCATYTKELDTVFNKTIVQERARKEVVNLKNIIKFLLQKFNAHNEIYPDKILVYRDGIGEGDFQKILNTELSWVQEACYEVIGNRNTKITYIMVQKRHNTRFIPEVIPQSRGQQKANMQNVKPGTVVDNGITHHKFNEFYLCSHHGAMGTSRPTKYVVLYDDNKLSSDEIQAATYQLCYLYPRCTKSSSIPPVVAYAHLLCTRGKSYIIHMDNSDGQSSVGSGSRIGEQLSENQLLEFNERISVKSNINGRLYFI